MVSAPPGTVWSVFENVSAPSGISVWLFALGFARTLMNFGL